MHRLYLRFESLLGASIVFGGAGDDLCFSSSISTDVQAIERQLNMPYCLVVELRQRKLKSSWMLSFQMAYMNVADDRKL